MSASDLRPIVVAYDGSPQAQAAVREAAHLFGGGPRPVVVLSVWEPGLMNVVMAPAPGGLGASVPPPDPETIKALDHTEEDHAQRVADDGCELARSLGLAAEPHAVRDEASVAETIVRVAEDRDAQALVIGTRGRSAIASALLGSTSEGVLHKTRRPLLVVHAPEGDERG